MGKFFLDTEFLEGKQDKRLFGFKYGVTKPTIDLVSIGIVSEDGLEYYAISKDFNLKEAWNRYQVEADEDFGFEEKVFWIRENVLFPIFMELFPKSIHDEDFVKNHFGTAGRKFSYEHLKALINWYGKTNKQIAQEITMFCNPVNEAVFTPVEFYTWYGSYDHVVFCWLFGRMIDLPEGFPMYTRDLKQTFDEKNKLKELDLKEYAGYPVQKDDEKHSAIFDARWIKRIYEFLITVK